MSRQGSVEFTPGESPLEVIREDQIQSPVQSAVNTITTNPYKGIPYRCCKGCKCMEIKRPAMDLEDVGKVIIQKENQLTEEFDGRLNKELDRLRERADYILQNEQVRASYMLREAHRERQEKISALQTQLECKNLAGLMYVMCSERHKSKMEKMAIIEEYTNYIRSLQDILAEAQTLILNLSRGYKTAARVDNEWREKMKKTLFEFQMFVQDYAKGTPESNQYFFDLPKLLETEASLVVDPNEDPCSTDLDPEEILVAEVEMNEEAEKPWYERTEDPDRPFIIFGDMAEFKPPQRRDVLRAQKVAKAAPQKWKEYVFHDALVKAECSNAQQIKDKFRSRPPAPPAHWECPAQLEMHRTLMSAESQKSSQNITGASRRITRGSADVSGGAMGSILKIITTSNAPQLQAKSTLLGARDSMEIASTTKLREKQRRTDSNKVVINVGRRRTSLFLAEEDSDEIVTPPEPVPSSSTKDGKIEEEESDSSSGLGSVHNDSLTKGPTHRTDRDKINYEKTCPAARCARLQVSSFLRSLPSYMRDSPFSVFEQTFDDYEACSPEQIAILRERIEKKKAKEKMDLGRPDLDPLEEWQREDSAAAVQTSDVSVVLDCTCKDPYPTPAESNGQIFNMQDLCPMKEALNQINRECFFDSNIQFNRFKVVGYESSDTIKEEQARELSKKKNRLHEVTKVLKQHPSLLDIFQANTV